MIVVTPCINELADGFLGRLARINLLKNERVTLKGLVDEFKEGSHLYQSEVSLARAVGMSLRDFAIKHTLLPYKLAWYGYDVGDLSDYMFGTGSRIDRYPILSTMRKRAYACPRCMKEQVAQYGFTYWLRDHQLPGAIDCYVHSAPLLSYPLAALYEDSPTFDGGCLAYTAHLDDAQARAIRSVNTVSTGFLHRQRTKHYPDAFCDLLWKSNRAFTKNVSLKDLDRYKHAVCYEIYQTYPSWWLELLWTDGGCTEGAIQDWLMNPVYFQCSVGLALLLLTLYVGPNEALYEWLGPDIGSSRFAKGEVRLWRQRPERNKTVDEPIYADEDDEL